MDAWNMPLIDLCCTSQAILLEALIRRSESGRKDGEEEGSDSKGLRPAGRTQLDLLAYRPVLGYHCVCVCLCVLLNWFPLQWQPQSGWHHCLPPPHTHTHTHTIAATDPATQTLIKCSSLALGKWQPLVLCSRLAIIHTVTVLLNRSHGSFFWY